MQYDTTDELIRKALSINTDAQMLYHELQAIIEYYRKHYSGGNTLEIGAYKGMTSYILLALMNEYQDRKSESRHHIVDLFDITGDMYWNYQEHPKELLLENVKDYEGLVKVHQGDSLSHDAMAFIFDNRPYDLIFIDGDHRYPNLLMELYMVDQLTDNILLHDYGHFGVTKSVDEFCKVRGYYVEMLVDGFGLAKIVKTKNDVLTT